ncbi:MAG: PhnA protein [Chitinophagaceae bacterium]|nr:MAG: PhnA protein [Chitinophagaceae bacterium]
MKLEDAVLQRSGNNCELCKNEGPLTFYEIQPQDGRSEDNCVMLCAKCIAQVDKKETLDSAHWKVLSETMWSEVRGIQVLAWRMLNRLRNESWAAEQLDMLYLDEDALAWAKTTGDHENDSSVDLHRDAYGVQLHQGDTVVLTKNLDVKGASVNARLGTVIKHIRLVPDNTEQIEGKIDGQQIVILTKYVRRQA